MPAYVMVLAEARHDKADGVAEYSRGVAPLLAAAGGKPLLRGAAAKTIAGPDFTGNGLVLEFPDVGAAEAFFEQDAYRALVPLRDESFSRIEIQIVG
jgi:uncharacterized protein (DUF1330 family)